MSKTTGFWVSLILGILSLLGGLYFFLAHIQSYNFDMIKWKEIFTSKEETTRFFVYDSGFYFLFLTLTAVFFYLSGLFFGKRNSMGKISKKEYDLILNENEILNRKINKIKVLYTSGKIQRKEKSKPELQEELILEEEVYIPLNEVQTTKSTENQPQEKEEIQANEFSEETLTSDQEKNISDDLTSISGITPKIELILNANGIYTFAHLAEKNSEFLKNILIVYGGPAYKMHDVTTWAEQAKQISEEKLT